MIIHYHDVTEGATMSAGCTSDCCMNCKIEIFSLVVREAYISAEWGRYMYSNMCPWMIHWKILREDTQATPANPLRPSCH